MSKVLVAVLVAIFNTYMWRHLEMTAIVKLIKVILRSLLKVSICHYYDCRHVAPHRMSRKCFVTKEKANSY